MAIEDVEAVLKELHRAIEDVRKALETILQEKHGSNKSLPFALDALKPDGLTLIFQWGHTVDAFLGVAVALKARAAATDDPVQLRAIRLCLTELALLSGQTPVAAEVDNVKLDSLAKLWGDEGLPKL